MSVLEKDNELLNLIEVKEEVVKEYPNIKDLTYKKSISYGDMLENYKDDYSKELDALAEARAAKLFGASFAVILDSTATYDFIINKLMELSNDVLGKPIYTIKSTDDNVSLINYKEGKVKANEKNNLFLAHVGSESGLMASGLLQNPVFYADMTLVELNGTLRSKGYAILTNDEEIYNGLKKTFNKKKKEIVEIAFSLKEASRPFHSVYARKVLNNAKALHSTLKEEGINVLGSTTMNNKVVVSTGIPIADKLVKELNAKEIYASTNVSRDMIIFDTTYMSINKTSKEEMINLAKEIAKVIR